ncbi:hypothetical protein L207DRAFT_585673 [Hyaloscypha variabilis F]|uniref:Uncharacterized protein n=1 Tax=Hyaloscypha variabilis (strain UAMH 11265 / GT02V1 / F) TaxID=1149755 RepID=A0A2J6RFM6_HYAVF|nr:hypothetical protein L207DRAFT_585673 [Hyaloscypha variabilis F]
MDVSEFIHQVNNLISHLRDPANNYLGREYSLNPGTSNIIKSLMYQDSSDDWKDNLYSTKLLAKPAPTTKARITVPLLEKLLRLKEEGPGERTSHMGVQWWFVVEEGELASPTFSSDEDDDGEDEYESDEIEEEEEVEEGEVVEEEVRRRRRKKKRPEDDVGKKQDDVE